MVRDVENKVRLARLRKNRSDRKAGALALICAALALVTFALYWRVQWNDFINYDDNVYIAENLHVLRGINGPDVKWAFTTGYTGYPHPVTWLAPARLPTLRTVGWRPSPHECCRPYSQRTVAVLVFVADDAGDLAERLRRGHLRCSSTARRISRVDCGTQRCAVQPVLFVDAARLCILRGKEIQGAVRARSTLFCPGTSLEADDRHAAVDLVASRLLAPGTDAIRSNQTQLGSVRRCPGPDLGENTI